MVRQQVANLYYGNVEWVRFPHAPPNYPGHVPERLMGLAWKASVPSLVPWVRIPLCPPKHFYNNLNVKYMVDN